MQALENAVKFMKRTPSEAQRARVDARDIPLTTYPEPSDEAPAPNPAIEDGLTAAAPLVRRRTTPLFAETSAEAQDGKQPEMVHAEPVLPMNGGGGANQPHDDDPDDRPAFGPILTWLGAAASVALIAGVSVWTYKLGQRDAMDVPIIAAMEGPARIAPENPGGAQISHQGLTVNSVLEGGGVAAVATRVTVAPASRGLTDEDAAQGELAAIAAARKPATRPVQVDGLVNETMETVLMIQELVVDTTEPVNGLAQATVSRANNVKDVVAEEVAAVTSDAPGGVGDEAAAQAVAEAIQVAMPAAPDENVVASASDVVGSDEQDVVAAVEEIAPVEMASLGPIPPQGEGSAYAPAIMTLPRARPGNLGAEMAAAVDAAVASVLASASASATVTPSAQPGAVVEPVQTASLAVDDLTVIPLPAGTRMIQLGAFDSEDVARRQWQLVSGRHSDLLGGKDYYVQKIDRSGKVFYRLRVAGYANKQETLSACAALTARGLPCMPAIVK